MPRSTKNSEHFCWIFCIRLCNRRLPRKFLESQDIPRINPDRHLQPKRWAVQPQIMEELQHALSSSRKNKSPGPDNIPLVFLTQPTKKVLLAIYKNLGWRMFSITVVNGCRDSSTEAWEKSSGNNLIPTNSTYLCCMYSDRKNGCRKTLSLPRRK